MGPGWASPRKKPNVARCWVRTHQLREIHKRQTVLALPGRRYILYRAAFEMACSKNSAMSSNIRGKSLS